MTGERVHIWSNGTEFEIWQGNNCFECVKFNADEAPTCELDLAILESMFGDQLFAPEIAQRLGYAGNPLFWCKERQTEPTPPKTAAQEMAEAGATPLPGFGAMEERR